MFVYYESIKRKLKTKYIWGCRCYERLQPNTKEFTRLAYTELVLELEHLKIETRLITGTQIGMFRTIRLDHTNCLQVAIKTHSFNRDVSECDG